MRWDTGRTIPGRAVPVTRGQLINPDPLPWAQRPGRWLAGRDGAPCRRGAVENDSHYQNAVLLRMILIIRPALLRMIHIIRRVVHLYCK